MHIKCMNICRLCMSSSISPCDIHYRLDTISHDQSDTRFYNGGTMYLDPINELMHVHCTFVQYYNYLSDIMKKGQNFSPFISFSYPFLLSLLPYP